MKSKPIFLKRETIKLGIILLVGIGFGIMLGVLFSNWSFFEFEKTIKYTDLMGLILTSGIGIYIARVIGHKESSSRAEKDYFMGEIQTVLTKVDKLKTYASLNAFPFEETKRLFKDVNENLHFIDELLSSSNDCKEVRIEKAIKSKIQKIRNQVTKVSPNATGQIILDRMVQNQTERDLRSVKETLGKLILAVNS